MMEKEEFVATTIEVEVEEISEEEVMETISIKKRAIILDHLIMKEVEIILSLLAKEE